MGVITANVGGIPEPCNAVHVSVEVAISNGGITCS